MAIFFRHAIEKDKKTGKKHRTKRAMTMQIPERIDVAVNAVKGGDTATETDKTDQKKFAAAMIMLRDTPRDAWVNIQTASDALGLGITTEDVLALYLAKKNTNAACTKPDGSTPEGSAPDGNGIMLALGALLSIWITIEDKRPIFRVRNNGVYMPPNYIRDWVKHAVAHPATTSELRHRFMRYVSSIESALRSMSPRGMSPRGMSPRSASGGLCADGASASSGCPSPSTPRASFVLAKRRLAETETGTRTDTGRCPSKRAKLVDHQRPSSLEPSSLEPSSSSSRG